MTKAQIQVSLKYWRNRLARAERGLKRNPKAGDNHQFWLSRQWKAKTVIAKREKQLAAKAPVRERAYRQAVKIIGVMEHGANNSGDMVLKIIRAAGGAGPEPWCGDTMFYVYRLAGSKAITKAVGRLMAYVPWISRVKGLYVIRKANWKKVRRGDIIRFEFTGDSVQDHTGMFDKWVIPGVSFLSIEGNTGATGAVSDSTTGGDGVYRKERSMSLVADFVRVTK